MMFKSSFIIAIILASQIVSANEAPLVEVVWVHPERNNYQIMYSRMVKEADHESWLEPEAIYVSKTPLSSPALNLDGNGNHLLVWSEVRRSKVVLMQSVKQANAERWADAVLFSDYGKENLGPSVVTDLHNRTWVFWAANTGDLDDIYYSHQTEAGWSAPVQANPVNEVPDFQALANLDVDGNILLTWQTFDMQVRTYVQNNRIFKLDNSQKSVYKLPLSIESELGITDVQLPDFVPESAYVGYYFPNNKVAQFLRRDTNQIKK